MLVDVLILALATWRIGRLIQYERGPKAMFMHFRRLFGIMHDDNGEPNLWPDNELAQLLACSACGSIWVGLCMAGFYLAAPRVVIMVGLPFALSAASIAMGVMIDGKG